MKPTLVLGASENIERYSNMAVKLLRSYHHTVYAIGNKEGAINDVKINKEKIGFNNVDTITLYLNAKNQIPYYDYILSLQPKRIIFNPGTENDELEDLAHQHHIQTLQACTLVLLRTNQY